MRLLPNTGSDRGIDHLRQWLTPGASVDFMSPSFSLLAFAELREALDRVDGASSQPIEKRVSPRDADDHTRTQT
jgi:hypothetical protein